MKMLNILKPDIRKKQSTIRRLKNDAPLFMMLLPGFILTFLFCYLPMFGIIIAFKKYTPALGIWSSPWVGLDNFQFLIRSSDTWTVFRNTLAYNLTFIFLGQTLNVALAVALTQIRNKRASKVYQTVMIMPYFLSYVIVSYIVYALLCVRDGFFNTTLLPMLGLDPVNWYISPKPWPFILTFVNFWKATGYGSIVYMAAIAGIDTGLYEAAEIDGANRFKQILYITLPSLKSIIIIQVILNIGHIFNSDFGLFYQVPMNSGALYDTTNVISTFVYRTLGEGGITGVGMSAAASFFQSIVGFVLVVVSNAIVRKIDNENALF